MSRFIWEGGGGGGGGKWRISHNPLHIYHTQVSLSEDGSTSDRSKYIGEIFFCSHGALGTRTYTLPHQLIHYEDRHRLCLSLEY